MLFPQLPSVFFKSKCFNWTTQVQARGRKIPTLLFIKPHPASSYCSSLPLLWKHLLFATGKERGNSCWSINCLLSWTARAEPDTEPQTRQEPEHRSAQGRKAERMSVKETLLIYFKHSSVSWVQHPTASPLQKAVATNHMYVPASLLIHKNIPEKTGLLCWWARQLLTTLRALRKAQQ